MTAYRRNWLDLLDNMNHKIPEAIAFLCGQTNRIKFCVKAPPNMHYLNVKEGKPINSQNKLKCFKSIAEVYWG
jgi:hypothetical protein